MMKRQAANGNTRPRVNAWYDNLAARPAFKTAVSWPDESGGGYEEVGLGSKVKLA
jgi:hypothetical protein